MPHNKLDADIATLSFIDNRGGTKLKIFEMEGGFLSAINLVALNLVLSGLL
jgi:hypothetical protein